MLHRQGHRPQYSTSITSTCFHPYCLFSLNGLDHHIVEKTQLQFQLKHTANGLARIHKKKNPNKPKVKYILIAMKQVMSLKIS